MRSLRTAAWLTRLADRLATQPLANSMYAVAMSMSRVSTRKPLALTRFTSERASATTRSRSWIIRSSTTSTSTPRALNGARRSVSMYIGRSRRAVIAAKPRLKRSTWPTCSTTLALLRQADQRVGLRQRRGDRLLDEHVQAVRDAGARDRVVPVGRNGDHDGVGEVQDLPVVAGRTACPGKAGGARRVRVDHRGERRRPRSSRTSARGSAPCARRRPPRPSLSLFQ